jgi:hypothetical protein
VIPLRVKKFRLSIAFPPYQALDTGQPSNQRLHILRNLSNLFILVTRESVL